MYGIDYSIQFQNLMPSLGLGFVLGAVYDVLSIVVKLFHKRKVVQFISDVFFVVLATLVTYTVALAVNFGHLRFYLILAEVMGFAAWKITFGILFSFVLEKITVFLKSFFKLVTKPFVRIFKDIKFIFEKIHTKNVLFLKKFKNKFKNHLKPDDKVLYNNKE